MQKLLVKLQNFQSRQRVNYIQICSKKIILILKLYHIKNCKKDLIFLSEDALNSVRLNLAILTCHRILQKNIVMEIQERFCISIDL